MIMIQLRRIQERVARGEKMITNKHLVKQISFQENSIELSLFNEHFDEEFPPIYIYGVRICARDRDD
jgi:hypothetical protein